METFQVTMREYRWLGLAVFFVAIASTLLVSCGEGGSASSSDGALCQQCGASDGPCQDTASIVPGADRPAPCPTPPSTNPACVERQLICRRKTDSAQQRCFPANGSGSDVDFAFRCDGSRPGGTSRPDPVTPTPTTPTVTPSPDPTSTIVL